MRKPIVFKTAHRIAFSDIDPYNHVSTARYATYFVDHRMQGLRDHVGWDVETLTTAPFMVFVRRLEIDFVRPASLGQDITITSFVRDFRGPDATIECTMSDAAGKDLARCLMIVAHVDRQTRRASDWPAERAALFYEKEGT
jgi:acyl-CoA thioester hydrolase